MNFLPYVIIYLIVLFGFVYFVYRLLKNLIKEFKKKDKGD